MADSPQSLSSSDVEFAPDSGLSSSDVEFGPSSGGHVYSTGKTDADYFREAQENPLEPAPEKLPPEVNAAIASVPRPQLKTMDVYGNIPITSATSPTNVSGPNALTTLGNPKGLRAPGNIDLNNRPVVHNADGSHSTEYSTSFGTDKGEVLVPTIVNGKFLTPDGKKPKEGSPEEKAMFRRAEQHYQDTGEHMGIFDTPDDADAYANAVHERGQQPTAPQPYSYKRAIAGGLTDLLTAPEIPEAATVAVPPLGAQAAQGAEELGTPGKRVRGALRLGATGLEAATPLIGPAAIESPGNVIRGVAEGYVGGKVAKKGAQLAGAEPETQELAESVGQMAPMVGEALFRPRFGVASTPEGTSVSAGVRGAGAGVAVTPEETVIRGKVGPLEKEVRIPRNGAKPPEQPALTPQTIEGELAANPPTRDEIADAQAATDYAGPDQAKAAVVAKRQADRAAASAAPPSGPEGAKAAGAVETRPTPSTPAPAASPAVPATSPATPELTSADVEMQPERRANVQERKRVDQMTPEEMQQELLTSKVTGLPNRRAYDEAEKPAAAGMSDADGLKAFNDKFGYDAGNALLQAKADALREAGLDAYHDKGDEFLYRGASVNDLNDKLEKAREILRNKEISIELKDGSQRTLKGVDFSYGTGQDLSDAETGLKSHKSEREAKGERARGELRGITETPGGIDNEGQRQAGELKRSEVEVELPPEEKYKHRSTQFNIPEESEAHGALESARQRISDADVAGQGKDVGGNHVTVRYGLTAKDDDELAKLKQYISSLSPFEATLGKTEKFPPSESSDNAAVIHAPIESPELQKINKELENHAPFIEPTFKEYKPHATIAYVKPEKADRYVGMNVTHGKKFKVNSIAITDRNGNQDEVKLEGKKESPGTRPFKIGDRVIAKVNKRELHGEITAASGDHVVVRTEDGQTRRMNTALLRPATTEETKAAGGGGTLTNDEMNKAYSRQKAALTKAENLTDHQQRKFAVLKAATQAVNEWEDKFPGWPDNWSRWQRALDDAYHKFDMAYGTSDQAPRLEDLVGEDASSKVTETALAEPEGEYEDRHRKRVEEGNQSLADEEKAAGFPGPDFETKDFRVVRAGSGKYRVTRKDDGKGNYGEAATLAGAAAKMRAAQRTEDNMQSVNKAAQEREKKPEPIAPKHNGEIWPNGTPVASVKTVDEYGHRMVGSVNGYDPDTGTYSVNEGDNNVQEWKPEDLALRYGTPIEVLNDSFFKGRKVQIDGYGRDTGVYHVKLVNNGHMENQTFNVKPENLHVVGARQPETQKPSAAQLPAESSGNRQESPNPEGFSLTAPPEDLGVQQYIRELPEDQRDYAKAVWNALKEKGAPDPHDVHPGHQFDDYVDVYPDDLGVEEDDADQIQYDLRRAAKDLKPQEPRIAEDTEEAIRGEVKAAQKPGDLDNPDLNNALRHALTRQFEGGEQRWAKLVRQGASDQQIKNLISDEFGMEGGFSFYGGARMKGGSDPKFWYYPQSGRGDVKPTLRGQELIDATRKLLKIPEPQGGADKLAEAVYQKLSKGDSLGNVTALTKMAEEAFGSSRTSGNWTPKDMFDAMETGVNKYLEKFAPKLMSQDAIEGLKQLRGLMDRLTSQGTRTTEQLTHQQFSTPPTEAYIAAKVAGIKPTDTVLEPSAGNGGLAVFAKGAGAKVAVNEIADRRVANLKYLGFDKDFPITKHDGEIINSLLGPEPKPTVILMNPPFSSGALKGEMAKNQTRYGFNHVDAALQRLQEGGRLVAIMGGGREGFDEGASLTSPTSRPWFEKIAQRYNIRANVRINGKEYQKYGTTYATRIIVIDKDGPMTQDRWLRVVSKGVDTLEEAYNALRKVADSRPQAGGENVTSRPAGSTGEISAGQAEPSGGLATNPKPGLPGVRTPAGGVGQTHGGVPAAGGRGGSAPPAPAPRPSGGPQQLPVPKQEGAPAGRNEGEAPGRPGGSAENAHPERPLAERGTDLERVEADHAREEEEEEKGSAYVAYRPTLKGGKHPANIVETKAMATVPMPPINYTPNLPASTIGTAPDYKDAKISAIQLEAVAIAGMQNDIVLPNGARASALIGDGTGVGKGREGAAILWDNWRKGRKRLVWMTKSKDLIVDAVRDLEGIGAHDLAKSIKNLGKLDAITPIQHEGVLFTTYALFRSGDKKGNTRAAQVDRWLRGNDDGDGGYMLMDESHNLKNAVVAQGQEASQIGMTVKKFLGELPKLRTVSLSATAATDVMNLGYLDRLGLWGAGTPFPNGFPQFATEIAGSGMSAMEMVARELKAQGKYVSRTLTFRGVRYREIEHTITPEQEKIYESACDAWKSISNEIEDTIKNTTNGGGRQRAMALSQFYSTQQRFFSLLLTSLKIPTLVEKVNQSLAEGKAVGITLINTNEAAQNREKDRVAAEESDEEPDYDFGPGRMLSDMVREHFPVQQWADSVDANGNPIKIPVVDAQGHPVKNPEAVAKRDALIERLEKHLHMPSNPLDELIEQLGGPSKVAELTGRKQRYDPATNRLVNRGGQGVSQDKVNQSEMQAFQSGKKLVAILSSAADTGISLHSDLGAKNQRQRIAYTLQVGWSADKALQMMGRFNRSNQANAPEYGLMKTNMGGESRFISSIARRMESLEALSKGQTKTNAGTEGMSKVNFETEQGRASTVAFYNQLLRNIDVPNSQGLGKDGAALKGMDILRDLGVLKRDPQTGNETVPLRDRDNITRLLNRLLALKPKIQNAVYDYFYDIFDAVVKNAIEQGTIDTGVKRIPGDSFHVKEFRQIASDPTTGAKTEYYPVEAQVRMTRASSKDFDETLKWADDRHDHPIVVKDKNGKLALIVDARPIIRSDGTEVDSVHIIRPEDGIAYKVPRAGVLQKMQPVDNEARQKFEQAEKDIDSAQADIDTYKKGVERQKERQEQYGYSDVGYYEGKFKEAKERLDDAKDARRQARAAVQKRDYLDDVRKEWQKQYEAAPTHKTVESHLIGGAVMRFWNAIREASGGVEVYTTVDEKTGKRVVGVDIPAGKINQLVARISGGASTVDSKQIIDDVLRNATEYQLEGGIKLRRGRVGREQVIQAVSGNQGALKDLVSMGVKHEIGAQPIYYLPNDWERRKDVLDKILEKYPVKPPEETTGEHLAGESGTFNPSKLNPLRIQQQYRNLATEAIGKLGLTKYYDLAKVDKDVADNLNLIDNAPRWAREKANANLAKVTQGLSEDQIRLASLMVDSDSRDYLHDKKPADYQKAINDPEVMAAVQRFKPLQDEMAQDRIALHWPVRRSLEVHEDPLGAQPWMVKDRDGNDVQGFKTKASAQRFVEKNGKIEPHLKRTYPEHMRSPLPAETGGAPYTGSFYANKGLRPPNMDKKSRMASAEYHYEHGAKDFSGYTESFIKTKEAVLKQNLFDDFSGKATQWTAGTAKPPSIDYDGKTYYRPDIALQMRRPQIEKSRQPVPGIPGKPPKQILEYSVYDPSRGERFLIRQLGTEEGEGFSTLTTGKPGIGPHDRFLGPKAVVDALENYDASRGGEGAGKLRKFFQEQIVGLFGPMVHVNNILRRVGQATGTGTFDPRSWPSIAKVITSPDLRARVLKGVDDSTIDMLVRRGAYTDWSDIGNLNAYVGGNLNPANWIRYFGKGVLFDPKFLGGWGGLDPKARVIIADYFKDHYPEMGEKEVTDAVNSGLGEYNRANWSERQRKIARFTLFPGWDFSSFKWFIRHPWITAMAPAIVTLAINLALHYLGKNKGDDEYDFGYIHWGDRKFRTGLLTESMAEGLASPILRAGEAVLQHEDIFAGVTEGTERGAASFAGTLAGPTVQMVANQLFNRKFAGSESEIVQPEDKYEPGTWAPTVDLEKRISYTFLKGVPAVNRFMDNKGQFDWMQGLGSIMGATNYRYGAEERLRANGAKARDLSKALKEVAERDPQAAQEFASNPARAAYLVFNGDLAQMEKNLKDIDIARARLPHAGLSESDRKEAEKNLDQARRQLLTSADAVNELLVRMKLQKPAMAASDH